VEEEALEYEGEEPEYDLPCALCRHNEVCNLWKDGREICYSFSCQN